jgi:hypothetical protein
VANPMVGSRVQQTCEPVAEKAVEVVRNHEGGTRSRAWQLGAEGRRANAGPGVDATGDLSRGARKGGRRRGGGQPRRGDAPEGVRPQERKSALCESWQHAAHETPTRASGDRFEGERIQRLTATAQRCDDVGCLERKTSKIRDGRATEPIVRSGRRRGRPNDPLRSRCASTRRARSKDRRRAGTDGIHRQRPQAFE